MNNFIPQTSLFIGIIPALIILYIGLKGYEGHFKDKLIFLTFIVGIIIGFISAVIELFTTKGIGLIIYIILFPVLEQLSKTIVLNLGRFQEKQETTIYGLSLGLGFGSVFTPAAIIMGNFQEINIAFIAAIIGSFGIILFHAATGAIIGYGVYSHKLSTYLTFAILLQIPITTVIGVTNLFTVSYLQISLVVYGIIVYWYVIKKIMPRILQESQRRKRTQKEIDIKSK
ncbi:MAG: protease PrsW [Thermoplasmata archaeon]|nr:protease PrsW [Thermoplasmata archaeon]MBE3136084.1 protease PrsW [Thermoplasmata archaeon]MBE3138985.1 protease PrsW [Thermoplasmata archaeon]